jgi:seryl-tRNA synthetase
MLDLGCGRQHVDGIERMLQNRGVALDLEPFREIDGERRKIIHATEQMKAERNKAATELRR